MSEKLSNEQIEIFLDEYRAGGKLREYKAMRELLSSRAQLSAAHKVIEASDNLNEAAKFILSSSKRTDTQSHTRLSIASENYDLARAAYDLQNGGKDEQRG